MVRARCPRRVGVEKTVDARDAVAPALSFGGVGAAGGLLRDARGRISYLV